MDNPKNSGIMIPGMDDVREKYNAFREQMVVVLVGTRGGLNLGAAARAMANFGFTRLRLVQPEADILGDDARSMAIEALPLLENAEVFDTLEDALQDCQYVFATTRRVGRKRRAHLSPPDMARMMTGLDPVRGVALVFGPENFGLNNREIPHCNAIVTLRTGAPFNSFNLAQAVMLMLYEIFRTFDETDAKTLADMERIEKLMDHAETLLRGIGFITGPDPDQVITRLRRLAERARPSWPDAGMLHAIMGHLLAELDMRDKKNTPD